MKPPRARKRERRWDEDTHVTIATVACIALFAGAVWLFGYGPLKPTPLSGAASATTAERTP